MTVYFDFIDNFNTIFPHHSHQLLLSHKMLTGKFTYYTMFTKKPSHIDIAIIPLLNNLIKNERLSPLSLYRSPDNRMILKQISKGDNHYLKKQQPS